MDGVGEHDWFQFRDLTCCRTCGIVKRADGTNKPCKGQAYLRPLEPTRPLSPDETTPDEAQK